jgi:CRP/FNR family transcriptional activator FtrB
MRESDKLLIRGFPLFRGVSDETFGRIAAASSIREVQAEATLLREGEKPSALFVLLNGLVETYASHQHTSASIAYLRPPAAFIVAAVISDEVQLTSARTLVPCRILEIPVSVVQSELLQDGDFARAVGLESALRYRDLVRELKNQRLRTAPVRLANWLLIEANAAGSAAIDLPFKKAELATRLGMSDAHLSRAFAQLRFHGVSVKGMKVQIDAAKLVEFAHPDQLMDG